VVGVLRQLARVEQLELLGAATPEGREQVVGLVRQLLAGVAPQIRSGEADPFEVLSILVGETLVLSAA
jgi:hypothetical protein